MFKSQLEKYQDFNSLVLVERQRYVLVKVIMYSRRELASHQSKLVQLKYKMNVVAEENRIDRQRSAMRYHKKINTDFNRKSKSPIRD